MSSPVSGVQAVLARIAQIQSSFVPPPVVAAPSTAGAASTSFASALAGVQTDQGGALANGSATAGPAGLGLTGLGPAGQGGQVTGDEVVVSAKKYLGLPYVFGGTTTAGLDCSGLVQKAYGDLGITLPRIAADQANTGTAVASLAQAQPGDILGFGQPAHHVALYLGNNMMIAAPEPGENVKIQSMYETPASIRRIVGTQDPWLAAGQPVTGAGLPQPGGLSGVGRYSAIFAQNEAKYRLPAGLLAAVAQTESGGNTGAVSPSGAQGLMQLMQLMPGTAHGLGVNPWDPSQAVAGAAQLLSGYLHSFGTVPLALAAYNAGPGAVEQYGGVPPYSETQNYVRKITGLMAGASS